MAIPAFVAIGVKSAAAGPAASVTPAMPTHQADDILFGFAESSNEVIALTAAQGFAEISVSPQGLGTAAGTTGNRLAMFWVRATSGAMTAPTIECPAGGAGNHILAAIASFRGCIATGDPWDALSGTTDATNDTNLAIPGLTSTVADCLILAVASVFTDNNTGQFGAFVNGDLANVAGIMNYGTNVGNGGGLGAAVGEKATAGVFGTTTTTLGNNSNKAYITLALRPPLVAATPSFRVAGFIG